MVILSSFQTFTNWEFANYFEMFWNYLVQEVLKVRIPNEFWKIFENTFGEFWIVLNGCW